MTGPTTPRRSLDANPLNRVMSHGRGGAGNIRPDPEGYKETEEDLKIPTLKSPYYTTGRGGTGNMAPNDPEHPENARIAQDVEGVPPLRLSGDFHGGRGGAGNVGHYPTYDSVSEAEAARVEEEEKQRLAHEHSERKRDYRGWADRGKDLLKAKFGGSKKSTSA